MDTVCSNCAQPKIIYAKELCKNCYRKQLPKTKEPLDAPELLRRFWGNVNKEGTNECWTWLASTNSKGYGKISYGGTAWLAHRLSWSIFHGREPLKGMDICHSCDNPSCCNPAHLTEGTRKQNQEDMVKKGRAGAVWPRELLKALWADVKEGGPVQEETRSKVESYLATLVRHHTAVMPFKLQNERWLIHEAPVFSMIEQALLDTQSFVNLMVDMQGSAFWGHTQISEIRSQQVNTHCLNWTGAWNAQADVGTFKLGRVVKMAHRIAWEYTFGAIPQKQSIGRICNDRTCIFPGHLKLESSKETAQRRSRKKHSDEIVAIVKAKLSTGEKPRAVAAATGIPVNTIRAIKSGRLRGSV